MKKKILVVDVGGSNVKAMISRAQRQKFKSGADMTPRDLVTELKSAVQDWTFDSRHRSAMAVSSASRSILGQAGHDSILRSR